MLINLRKTERPEEMEPRSNYQLLEEDFRNNKHRFCILSRSTEMTRKPLEFNFCMPSSKKKNKITHYHGFLNAVSAIYALCS